MGIERIDNEMRERMRSNRKCELQMNGNRERLIVKKKNRSID